MMGPRQIRWIVITAAVVVLALVIAWLFAPRAVPVDLASARIGPITESVADQGAARVREAYLVAAPVSGRLHRIDLHVGDRVVAGRTVVARIDPASDLLDPRTRSQAEAGLAAAAAAVRAATAQRDSLAAQARRAEDSLARIQALAAQGYAAPQALDDAEASARAARAAVRAAEAEIGVRKADLARSRAGLADPESAGGRPVLVTAPATGYVTRVLQQSAGTVAMGGPLVEIGDESGLEAAVEFLSQEAVRMREGMTAEIFDWGGARPIPALVRRVEPQGFTKVSALGVEEQRVLVLLQFAGPPDSRARLGPGYRVWGRVFLRRASAVLKVPLGALVRADGGWAVFRAADGRVRLTPVQVGAMTDREAEVRSGLSAGDRVVIFPSDSVRDGARIKPR
ncbi:MAG: efflux RND transporter periplasmic adaptor subunit [Caulobacter sp.]|nr:efflux RND transporter periplasmic adaptor subunit [Caulobacter sp.]